MNFTSEITLANVQHYLLRSGVLRQIPMKTMLNVLELATGGRRYYVFPHLDWGNKALVLWAIYCAFKNPSDYAVEEPSALTDFLDLLPPDLLNYLHQVHN